ncbi:zinc finger matrin-type protein [Musa troglodytarum]|uniref:Zinc finger matrin-type protein n=1 Tax=Musa troglodytarum TaxID=320322 RepID=A0A9E7L171_9LILI|nr:zinc finger matrin-type protein [Musa troglodytarum]
MRSPNSNPKKKAPPVQRKPLKHRNYEVDLESRLGKTQTHSNRHPRCYPHCTTKPTEMLATVISWVVVVIIDLDRMAEDWLDATVRSVNVLQKTANYLDHINGKKRGSESSRHVYAGGEGNSSTGSRMI